MKIRKAEITDFTEVQDVAKGGIISLPNKKRKKYARGPEIDDIEEMDEEIITPFVDKVPQEVGLNLPKLKKVGSSEPPKIKLPKLKKVTKEATV